MVKSVYGSDYLSPSKFFRWYALFREDRDRRASARLIEELLGIPKKNCASNFDLGFSQTECLCAVCIAPAVR
jgi:hypothetical protein